MAFLAQVRASMDYDGGTILLGHSSCLFPSKKLHTGAQWHFTNADDSDLLRGIMSYPECAETTHHQIFFNPAIKVDPIRPRFQNRNHREGEPSSGFVFGHCSRRSTGRSGDPR